MALSLNEGSKGLLQDPFNGVADLEAKLIRILQITPSLKILSRLIRATRFAYPFRLGRSKERTAAALRRLPRKATTSSTLANAPWGYEIEQLAYEDEPAPHRKKRWKKKAGSASCTPTGPPPKIDVASLTALMKTRQQIDGTRLLD